MHLRTGTSKQHNPSCGRGKHDWYITDCVEIKPQRTGNLPKYRIYLACTKCRCTTQRTRNRQYTIGDSFTENYYNVVVNLIFIGLVIFLISLAL